MSHHHEHDPIHYNKAFSYAIGLNISYIAIEASFGIVTGSMALLADAGHNLSDVLGLALAWGASFLMTVQPTKSRTYGFRKSSILAAMLNSIILFITVGAIGVESFRRIFHPEAIHGTTMMLVAGVGIVINGASALFFMKDKERDLNKKGAFIHLVADAGISLGVVFAGLIINLTGYSWVDPLISLLIMIVIIFSTWQVLRDSVNLAMDSVPPQIDSANVVAYLKALPGIIDVHDLHIWALSTTETALTVHLVKDGVNISNDETKQITSHLEHEFGIGHATIQYELLQETSNCTNNHGCC